MKRDMELMLKILQYFEEREEVSVAKQFEITGYQNEVVAYHCRRMYEAGLLDAEAIVSGTTPARLVHVLPFGLTWEGHEFLDAMCDETVSEKVRSRLGGELVNVPFTLIKELALAFGRTQRRRAMASGSRETVCGISGGKDSQQAGGTGD